MITKAKIDGLIDERFSQELTLHQVSKQKLSDFIEEQILAYCKPECMSCFDKAYVINEITGTNILYCHCRKGQDLKKLIEANYEPKSEKA